MWAQKKSLNSTFWLTKYGVKSKRQKRARRQNENIPSYRSLSVSNGGWCYSNRTVIKASISSHLCALCLKTHAHKHTLTHTCRESQKCFVPPAHFKSIKGCACVYTCVCLEGGLKSFLITHLSHEKHSAYFVWALAVWLIQLSSHSNCSLYTKLPLFTVFFYLCLPPFHFLPSFLWFLTFFRLFILVYWCMLARSSSHRGKLLLGDSGFDSTHSLSVFTAG